jgi:hypothetical protein
MHRIRVDAVFVVGLLCAIGALACGSEKPRTESSIPAQSAASVDSPGTSDSGVSARVETLTQDDNRVPDNAWARADEQTRRLHPDAFSNLPAAIVGELQRLGCSIPQTDGTRAGASQRDHGAIPVGRES